MFLNQFLYLSNHLLLQGSTVLLQSLPQCGYQNGL